MSTRRDPLPGTIDGTRRAAQDQPPLPSQGPREPAAPTTPATGIDYLGLIASRHEAELARHINYSQLSLPDELILKPKPDPAVDPVGDTNTGTEEVGA